MGLAGALPVLALLSWAARAWEVPPPTNVIIESYNFNISVFWDYKNVSLEPLFTVEIECYMSNTNYVVDTCVNISHHYCDLTYKIAPNCAKFFWARVKAVAGLHESSYMPSKKYNVFQNGRVGPPKLHLSLQNDEVNVLIEHPLTPYFKDNYPLSVRENITDFSYTVFMWPSGSSEKALEFDVEMEACGKRSCTINLPVPTPDIMYCVSAQGISEEEVINGEKSIESCIRPTKHLLDLAGLIIASILVAVLLGVILTIIAVCICLKHPNVKLPKSLATVVRSIKPSEIKPESRCKVSIYKPVMPKDDNEDLIEHTDRIEELHTSNLSDCDKEVNTGDSKRPSSKTGEMSIQDGTAVEIPASEHSLEANYSKSVSGQEEPCNMLPSLELPTADVRQPTNIGRCRNVSGYDKPHWRDSNSEGEAALV